MSDDELKKNENLESNIDIGDMVVKGYESCWIPHYDFKIVSKASKK